MQRKPDMTKIRPLTGNFETVLLDIHIVELCFAQKMVPSWVLLPDVLSLFWLGGLTGIKQASGASVRSQVNYVVCTTLQQSFCVKASDLGENRVKEIGINQNMWLMIMSLHFCCSKVEDVA